MNFFGTADHPSPLLFYKPQENLFLFLFIIAFVNLLFIIFMFPSATVKSNVHLAAVKFGFLARFGGSVFSAIVDIVTLE